LRVTARTLADHCVRLLREKETLQRQLTIAIGESYTVTSEEVIDETDYSKLKKWPLPYPDNVVPPTPKKIFSEAICPEWKSHLTGTKCASCGITPWMDGARL
jgi:hypothetical protein